MIEYVEGYKLKENEYLLKIDYSNTVDGVPVGFMTRYNQNGTIPVPFLKWGEYHYKKDKEILPIFVFEEAFNNFWKVLGWRFGKSQNWAVLKHPHGFAVEVYLENFLAVLKDITIYKGVLIGEFKWEARKLIKK